jgi:DNA-3-methyladenine glycosylase I
MKRCAWAGEDTRMIAYHDAEWGVPLVDDVGLFEFLTLEGAQAGLSWSTILNKREAYRAAFAGFDPERVAAFDARRVGKLLRDPGIVRHRLKINSTVVNASRVLEAQREFGSFAEYVWSFVGGVAMQNRWTSLAELPAQTPESRAMSRDMRRRGFKFVGPTTCYAFMQAVGLVNDHEAGCFRHAEVHAT